MFGTSGVRGRVGEDVTASLALSIGRAVGSTGATKAVVGRDPRESGRFLADALSAGLRECGADVVDLGLASTPAVARSVAWREADVGVSITASHNPPEDNGIKLWSPSGQAFDEERRDRISAAVESADYDLRAWDEVGAADAWDGAREAHARTLEASVSLEDPPSVVVDLGNGAGGVTADVLYALGCDVETLNAQPDGRFPGRPSEPTAETLGALCRHVEATGADLGIAHDGDADRMMAVDGTGSFVEGDLLLALFGRAAAGRGDRVAAPVNTSLAVDDALAAVGAELTRTRVGDVYVAERATEPDVAFGGEPSGAWIWPDETLCPDGPLAACKLVELVSREGPLDELLADVEPYPLRRESVEVDDRRAIMAGVEADVLDAYDDVTTVDGVRVEDDGGWFLVRASGTQPLIRLTAEARSADRADELLATARDLVARNRE
ncbi:MAG: phosphoglucosamine mutase [Salinigranum sp.]